MHEPPTLDAPPASLRGLPTGLESSTKSSLGRRLKTYIVPDTDIETYPDLRSRKQKLYHASLFVVLGILVVPWLCIVGTMWLTLTLLGVDKPKAA